MAYIELSEEQSRLLSKASFPIRIIDARGTVIGEVGMPEEPVRSFRSLSEEEETAEALRRREDARLHGGILYTTKEVLEHLRELAPDQPPAP